MTTSGITNFLSWFFNFFFWRVTSDFDMENIILHHLCLLVNGKLKIPSLFIKYIKIKNKKTHTLKWLFYILICHCTSLSPWFIILDKNNFVNVSHHYRIPNWAPMYSMLEWWSGGAFSFKNTPECYTKTHKCSVFHINK